MSDYEGLGEEVSPEEVATVGEAILRAFTGMADGGEIICWYMPSTYLDGLPWDVTG